MAITREIAFVINLENVVQTRLDSFVNVRKKIRARTESQFQRRVSEEGLSYQAQLEYYQTQLEKERKGFIPDQDYITEINDSIANLKKLVRYEKIRNTYLENYTQYKEGRISNDSFIGMLKSQLETIDDPDLRKEINNKISESRIAKVENDRKALENRITLAQKDRSIDLINTMISEVEAKKNDAYAIGDRELATFYEVKLQALKSQKGKVMVEDKMQSIDFKATKDGLTSIQKLNLLNDAVVTADTITPLTIDNKNYNSEAEYWQQKRNNYLAGSGDGIFKGFFDDITAEAKNKINTISDQSKFGYVSTSVLDAIDKDFKTLAAKPEFQPYAAQIENYRTSVLSYGLNKSANAIIDEAVINYTFKEGEQLLTNLQDKFGISMSSYQGDLYFKQLTMPAMMEAETKLAEAQAQLRGTTVEKERQKLAFPSIEKEEIIKPTTSPISPTSISVPISATGQTQITIPSGATLSGLASQYKTTVSELMKINPQITDPNKIYAGNKLNVPSSTPAPALTPSGYTGVSIIDYLKSIGQPSDFTSRAKLAQQKGITNYTGTAEQNTQLLNILRTSASAPAPAPAPAPPVAPPAPISTPTQSTTPSFSAAEAEWFPKFKSAGYTWAWIQLPTGEKNWYRLENGQYIRKSSETEAKIPFTQSMISPPPPPPPPSPAAHTPATAPVSIYTGVSIVDYLKSIGQPSDYASRATLAAQKGIANYTGTSKQNTDLLKLLRGF